MNVKFEFTIIKIGDSYIATANIGGIQLRAPRATDKVGAARNMLFHLARTDQDDPALAIELALAGTDLTAQLELGAKQSDDSE